MGNRDILLQMGEELKKAIEKPSSKRTWGMLIDTRACVGCSACTVACMAENVLPPGVLYRPTFEMESGKYPNTKRLFVTKPCMQCSDPVCVKDCPENATYKALWGIEKGIVVINYEKCIGCGICVEACPYQARSIDSGSYYTKDTPVFQSYETRRFNEYSSIWSRDNGASPIGKARKCHFCIHRLKEGMLPACVTSCVARAVYFGDIDDPESTISLKIKANKTATIKNVPDNTHDKGSAVFGQSVTKPNVFYIL